MQILEKLPKETARDYALRVLKNNIISLALTPGSMVSENELSAELGLSRTPVREALIELGKAQIVEILPQRGSRIALIDYSLVEESRFLRLVLEKSIVELLCENSTNLDLSKLDDIVKLQEFYLNNNAPNKLLELDNEFHKELFRLAHKLQTYQLLDSMTTHFDRVRTMSLISIKDIKIIKDHSDIVQAIRNQDINEAKALITKHLSRYKIDEETIRKQYPNYFK